MGTYINDWICIDFGTCNTTAAIEIDGNPRVVTFGNTQFFPTTAIVMPDGNIQVCQNAEALRSTSPETFLQEFKLKIAEELDLCGFQYDDIVAEILRFVKGAAEVESNKQLNNVILTIPAIYTEHDNRMSTMRKAAEKAGFHQIEFLSEPEAAAIHYSRIIDKKHLGLSLVYDLGGGTFDPALIDTTDIKKPRIIGSENGNECGGHFFDRSLYQYIKQKFKETNSPLQSSQRFNDYLACKRLKETLSIQQSASQYFSNGKNTTIDRSTFNSLIKENIAATIEACNNLLHKTGKNWKDLNQILLVGGSTMIPYIRETLQKHLISNNASKVKVIRNTTGDKGEFNSFFATSLGGICSKIVPPAPPAELIGKLIVNGKVLQLKEGMNTFGRDPKSDFHFDDPTMSRLHFSINVTKDANGKRNYTILTHSETKPTILNNLEPLDLRYFPISRKSAELQDGWKILAGRTIFQFKRL